MTFLLIAAVVAAMILLYGTDRLLKALNRARRYRAMSERLEAAAERSEAQQEQRKTAAAQSAALTSVMPAINRPPLTLPGMIRPPRPAAADTRPRPRPGRRSGRAGHVTGPHQR
jgi:Flp pilus assembly protein TadB